ncbi:MAG TPA: SDR family NAD(P)-dependent oxidoreductase, partial [Candidatus Baltobacteraceae bacterium]|nr:SDR family NAD(P)-dependent oxidoreductase [Candidatus Baltobacteraceae bacterium]
MSGLDVFSLAGRVALVTGGGGGIGAALAESLAGAGARVAVVGRTAETLAAAVDRVEGVGGEALAVVADVTDEDAAQAAVAHTVERFGAVDILINAVGGGAGKALHPAEAYPRKDWDWIMELNLRSTIVPTQPVVRHMIERGGGGAVLNISSVRANLGINAGYSAYVAAKGAISSLTRQWATEWARYAIRVNAIMPTFVDTPQIATL